MPSNRMVSKKQLPLWRKIGVGMEGGHVRDSYRSLVLATMKFTISAVVGFQFY